MFLVGGMVFAMSKEIYVLDHGAIEAFAFIGAFAGFYYTIGDILKRYLDKYGYVSVEYSMHNYFHCYLNDSSYSHFLHCSSRQAPSNYFQENPVVSSSGSYKFEQKDASISEEYINCVLPSKIANLEASVLVTTKCTTTNLMCLFSYHEILILFSPFENVTSKWTS